LGDTGLVMPAFGPRFHFGWVGVEIFFVISGFVIAFTAEGASSRAFLRSRVLRLVPGPWICATIALVLYDGVILRPLGTMLPGYSAPRCSGRSPQLTVCIGRVVLKFPFTPWCMS
jgi:peptidoglycan/LPS O-acetylase OafA/YrhL